MKVFSRSQDELHHCGSELVARDDDWFLAEWPHRGDV
jgi:hypothetical protein